MCRVDASGCAFVDVFVVCLGGGAERTPEQRAAAIGDRCTISEGTISIDMDAEADEIEQLRNQLSMKEICDEIAKVACSRYYDMYGQEFLLSDKCVSFEIEAHIDAYYWSVGETLIPNYLVVGFWAKQMIDTQGYNASSVYDATKSIDIRERDVVIYGYQSIAFGYRNGIRDVYIGTSRDPWANTR